VGLLRPRSFSVFARWRQRARPSTWFLGPTRHLDRFGRFCADRGGCDWHIHRHADRHTGRKTTLLRSGSAEWPARRPRHCSKSLIIRTLFDLNRFLLSLYVFLIASFYFFMYVLVFILPFLPLLRHCLSWFACAFVTCCSINTQMFRNRLHPCDAERSNNNNNLNRLSICQRVSEPGA